MRSSFLLNAIINSKQDDIEDRFERCRYPDVQKGQYAPSFTLRSALCMLSCCYQGPRVPASQIPDVAKHFLMSQEDANSTSSSLTFDEFLMFIGRMVFDHES